MTSLIELEFHCWGDKRTLGGAEGFIAWDQNVYKQLVVSLLGMLQLQMYFFKLLAKHIPERIYPLIPK
jgi:hypothetical protein